MTLNLDRTWVMVFTVALAACAAIYWQAKVVERTQRPLPHDLGLQLEDVGVGVGDEGNLAGAQVDFVAVPVM